MEPEPEKPRVLAELCKHHFIWLWSGSSMLERVECTTCGEIRSNKRQGDPVIIKEGKIHDPVQRSK